MKKLYLLLRQYALPIIAISIILSFTMDISLTAFVPLIAIGMYLVYFFSFKKEELFFWRNNKVNFFFVVFLLYGLALLIIGIIRFLINIL
ncbi:hypothetical protein [Myroides phaeus]|uniref:hypothetical protein n=1 Tax=Myroides phaeus TaxID=702745 RepID=UPI00130365D4|nr:hypothetical protein [Myroides phaeus]